MRSTTGMKMALGSDCGGARVKPVDVGKQHQQIGAHHRGDAGGEPVIVAIADFAGRDRVVLIDHRHGAELEQRADRRAGIEIAAPLLGVAERQQDLAGGSAIAEYFRPGPRERDLADSGRGLALFELQRALGQAENAAPERDGAGRDQQDLAPAAGKLRDVGDEGPASLRASDRWRGRPAARSRS
jgi:hypothetical protein